MAVSNNKYSLLLICLIALLLAAASAQRGGSGSSSSSRSSRGFRRSSFLGKYITWTNMLPIIAIFCGMLAYSYFSTKKDEQKVEERRKEAIEKELKDYETRVGDFPSTLDEGQRSIMLDTFMKRSHAMEIIVGEQTEKFYCQMKVLDLKRESDTKYRISMSGSDEVGKSKIQGLLLFWSDGMGFKLYKVYEDREKANQTGNFDILLYEGAGTPHCFKGEWAFYGYETSTEYSGTWTMIEI